MTLILLLYFSFSTRAEILVAGPEISEKSFQEALSRHHLISPVDKAIVENDTENIRPAVFAQTDECLKNKKCRAFQDNFAELREQFLLNRKELNLLVELLKKSSKAQNCYWKSLFRAENSECSLKEVDIEGLGLKQSQSYVIFVDGRAYKNGEQILLAPNTKYHWKIISARHLPKQVWATPEEIQHQVSLNQPYVSGGCLSYTHAPEINSEVAGISAAFDQTCVKKLGAVPLPSAQERSWLKENKKWLIPALIFVAGTAYYMKDKQVEVSSSF